jgi:hypothetical protein
MIMTNHALASSASATVFDGFYLRNNLDCNGDVPSMGPYDLCPDIIQSATQIENPQSALSTPASWATSYNVAPTPGITNYYYVRGLNGAADAVTANVALYYAPAQLILFPESWQNNRLSTSKGSTVSIQADSGAIGVGDTPLLWKNTPSPAVGDFYSFVAQAVDEPNVATPPVITTWTAMSTLLTQDLNYGFNTTAYVDADEPTWYARLGLTIPSSIASSGQVMLMISSNGFTSGTVGLIGDLFTSNQSAILLNPFTLTQGGVTSLTVTLDPGFSSMLTLQYWPGSGTPPASGSTITLSASYIIPPEETGQALAAGIVNGPRATYLTQSGIGPTATAILGSATFVVS